MEEKQELLNLTELQGVLSSLDFWRDAESDEVRNECLFIAY